MSKKFAFLPAVHHACSTDSLRPSLCCVYVENGIASATDATMLVRAKLDECSSLTPIEVALLNGKFLPRNAWATLCSVEHLKVVDDGIEYINRGLRGKVFFDTSDLKFPEVKQVFPKGKRATIEALALDPRLFERARKVFGGLHVVFDFYGNDKVIVMQSPQEPAIVGIAMPVARDLTEQIALF